MATDKRVTFNDYGEPVVVITIRGWDDAFRFAWALAHLQCEFVDLGRRIGGSLRRRLGAERFREFHARFTSGSLHWARDDPDESEAQQSDHDRLAAADALVEEEDDGSAEAFEWYRGQVTP